MEGVPVIEIVLVLVLGMLVGAGAAVLLQRRHARKMRALLERLGELEAMVRSAPGDLGPEDRGIEIHEIGAAYSVTPVTADVLAGRTTYVQRLVEGGTVQGLPLADQAIILVHAHLEDNLTPADLAREINVSLRSLERGLALALGCAPRELILAVKMREARKLLERGELNVTGVACRLGFSSPSHFSRRFRAFFKVPPSEISRRAA